MAPPTPEQQRRRARFESLIRVMTPFLDLVLVAGEGLSRVVGPDDEYLPVRAPSEAFELGAARAGRRRAPAREPGD